ncbi:MAG: 2-oxoacid:acceptor oxidoreductase family protein [Chloroflexi bacterium]|nr:2-oxoacid:acceptor oxidoreductase family protein [Chloroflexota bacterium]
MGDFLEIRWHGRGGQGVVTAAKLLAETYLEEGKYFQAQPEYGAERMGAPIRAYSRFSDKPIPIHCAITEPDFVVVLDPTLIGVVDITEGLKEGGTVVINTAETPEQIKAKLGLKKGEVFTVNASRISMEALGRNLPNTPILGALTRAMGTVDKAAMVKEIRHKLGQSLRPDIVEANVNAYETAYAETAQG